MSEVFTKPMFILPLLLFAAAVFAVTSLNSPSACSGQWTNCAYAFADDANRTTATATSSSSKTGTWNNYGFSIDDSSVINNVTVRADFFASNSRGYINIKVSGDGGATFGSSHIVGGNTAEQTFLIDVTNDVVWTPSKLSNANLRVNVTCFKQGSRGNPKCNLDWIPVQVVYTPSPFDFSVAVNPNNGTVVAGNSTSSVVTVILLSGSTQSVSLSMTGCPASTSCLLIPSVGNPTYTSDLLIFTNVTTPAGTYPLNITGTGGGLSRSAFYTLTVS